MTRETWTRIDRAGAAYILLNVVFWWTPLAFLTHGLELFLLGAVLGLVRDAAIGAVLLGYRMVRLQRSLT